MFLAADEIKHVVLLIFHAFCTCLTVEDILVRKKKEKSRHESCVSTTYRLKILYNVCYIFFK